MNKPFENFALRNRDGLGLPPVLAGVNATGRLDGVLFELTLRQTYRNTSDRTLEVVYTFPLPAQAVLLGFASELNGLRQVGRVTAKRKAEARYEQALADGDAPVMLEALPNGLCTANLGNLKPGDDLVLEVRFAQVLSFEQGRLRLAIPTAIAPRFGNPISAGLQAQQVPEASLLAAYPLDLSVTVAGDLAHAHIDCPTHRFSRTATVDGKRLDLAPGAWLDRDVVIVVTPEADAASFVVQADDNATSTVAGLPSAPIILMAALQARPAARRDRIHLKLLVDCSGSMAGDSIASARTALHGVLAGLTEVDVASLTRFGSSVEPAVAPARCTPEALRRLRLSIAETDANLGGTEMQAALMAVFALRGPRNHDPADVLLVTDGEVWQADAIIAAAQASAHRVFVIGVGSSPAEGVLRSLAEATGGACEFATPGEALEAAARRMLVRMRQPAQATPRIDWGTESVWQTALPRGVSGGDTVIAFAGVNRTPDQPIRLLVPGLDGVDQVIAQARLGPSMTGNKLARIAAARRLTDLPWGAATELAVAHQLMSARTNFILVHERADSDQATDEAVLQRVGGMLAAGWGATGFGALGAACMSFDAFANFPDLDTFGSPLASRSSPDPAASIPLSQSGPFDFLFGITTRSAPMPPPHATSQDILDLDLGSPWPSAPDPAGRIQLSVADPAESTHPLAANSASLPVPKATWQDILDAVMNHLASAHGLEGLAASCQHLMVQDPVPDALQCLLDDGFNLDEAWLLLARWIADRGTSPVDTTALSQAATALDAGRVHASLAHVQSVFDRYEALGGRPSRMQRLRRVLGSARSAGS